MQRLVLLAETEPDLLIPVCRFPIKAAAGDGGNTDVLHQMRGERHVVAKAEVMDVGRSQACEAMAEVAFEVGANLIVSGGYGHSRVREWAFGGVTRSLLRETGIHRLMSN